MTAAAAPRPTLEAWQYAMRAVLLAICVGSFIVTLANLGVRIAQVGFLGGPPADAPAIVAPPPPPVPTAQDSALAALPFSELLPTAPPPPGVDTRSNLANGLLFGALAGVFAAGLTAWTLLGRLGSVYRRGALSIASSIGTLVGIMLAVPFDMLFRQLGLIAFALLLVITAWRAWKSIADVDVIESPPAA